MQGQSLVPAGFISFVPPAFHMKKSCPSRHCFTKTAAEKSAPGAVVSFISINRGGMRYVDQKII
jgi:hypothetical protein